MCSIQSTAGEGPGLLTLVDGVLALLGQYADSALYGVCDEHLDEALFKLGRAAAGLAAVKLTALREMDGRELPGRLGATGAAALLRGRYRERPTAANEQVRVAKALDDELTATGDALRAGAISYDHTRVIVKIVSDVHPDVPFEYRQRVEPFLLEHAPYTDPAELAVVGRSLLATLNPDPDEDDAKKRAKRTLSLHEREDGMTDLRARLDPEAAALVNAAIDPLAAPEPQVDGRPDPRTPGQRRADALVEILHRVLGSATLPATAGARPHVSVLIPFDTLIGHGHQPGHTEHGHLPLPRTVVDRVCCDATVRRIVLGPTSEPLDVGRAARTATPAIRRAVVARDRLCTFPHCDRPAGWSEVHHLTYWNRGGETSIANLALVCSRHHDKPHYDGWRARLGPAGRIEWQAPCWIDPDQRWRVNPIREAREPYDVLRPEPP